MSEFTSLSPAEITILASIVSIIIANDMTPSDVENLGNFITAIGGNLTLIASLEQAEQEKQDKLKQVSDLESQVKEIKKDL